MMAACQGLAGLCGVIVEGGHPGLQNAEQRAERQRSDRQWAQRFCTEPLTAVFADWYQQPVFASLNDDQRRELVALRSNNNGATLAAMLEATTEPLTAVFADWYQQPVFASLNDDQRRELVALRSNNNGATLAAMLEATSLAVQPSLFLPRSMTINAGSWWRCAATIMAQPLPPCWRRLLSPSSLIYVLTLAPAHLRFIIYVVNVTANSAPWRRNWLPTAMSFLAPDITRTGKIPLA